MCYHETTSASKAIIFERVQHSLSLACLKERFKKKSLKDALPEQVLPQSRNII